VEAEPRNPPAASVEVHPLPAFVEVDPVPLKPKVKKNWLPIGSGVLDRR
jgi:hypothetical protein